MSDRTAPAPSEALDAPAGGPLALPWRWLSLGMFALIFLAAFEVLAVTTVMPLVAEDLDGAWQILGMGEVAGAPTLQLFERLPVEV